MAKFKFIVNTNSKNFMDCDLRDTNLDDREILPLRRAGFVTVGDLIGAINSDEDIDIPRVGTKKKFVIMKELFKLNLLAMSEDKQMEYLKSLIKLNGTESIRIIEALLEE